MELLILWQSAGTRVHVHPATEHRSVPAGYQARVIGPGESHLGLPYDAWHRHLGEPEGLPLPDAPLPGHQAPPKPSIAVGEVLDRAFALLRHASLPVVALAAALSLPAVVAAARVPAVRSLATSALIGAASLAWGAIAQAVLILALSDAYRGLRPEVAGVLRRAARRSGAIVGAGLLAGTLTMLGVILLVIPGIILYCLLYVAPAVVVLEDRGPGSSLERSTALTTGSGWKIFGISAVLYVLFQLVNLGVAVLERAGGALAVAGSAAGLAASTFATLFSAAVVTAMYYALRVAKEGYDLELLADTLGPAEAAPPPPVAPSPQPSRLPGASA